MRTWRTIDFRPLPPGWRLVYLTNEPTGPDDAGFFVQETPGVLVQEFAEEDEMDSLKAGDRDRRVVAANFEGGELVDATQRPDQHLWLVLGPSDPVPDAAAEVEERDRRLRHAVVLADLKTRLALDKAQAG